MKILLRHFSNGWSRIIYFVVLTTAVTFSFIAVITDGPSVNSIPRFFAASLAFSLVFSMVVAAFAILLVLFVWIRNGFRKDRIVNDDAAE
jgi:hypothetical protein